MLSCLNSLQHRLRGCYEATDGGKLQDSVVDLTGGISETIDIKDKTQIPVDIYEILWRSWKMNSFLGCSISVGLVWYIPVCRY